MAYRPHPVPYMWDSNTSSSTLTTGGTGNTATFTAAADDYYVVFSVASSSGDVILGPSGNGVVLENGAGGERSWGTYVDPGTDILVTGNSSSDEVYATRFKNKL